MSSIFFEGRELPCGNCDTVLDALLQQQIDIPNSCRAGACQACLVAAQPGSVPADAQQGLSVAQRELGYFLSCQCKPLDQLRLSRVDAAASISPARLLRREALNDQVYRVVLESDLDFRPGQYVTLWRGDNLARSYSLAGQSGCGELEFHIKCLADGALSPWLCEQAQPGETVGVQGPIGQCFYTAEPDQPLLLTGIGTGLAPLYGVLGDALSRGHTGPISLVLGGARAANFYLVEDLKKLAAEHEQLSVTFVARDDTPTFAQQGDVYGYVREAIPKLDGFKIYLCGAPSFVQKMRKQCFLAGAPFSDISADPFIYAT